MSDHTLSMDEVRAWFPHRDDQEKFDLALATHDRKIAAEALRDAADEATTPYNTRAWLRARADRIEQGGES